MNGTAVVALVVFAVCVLGVGFSIYRTRAVIQRNRRRAATRQAAFSEQVSSLLTDIKTRKAQGLPYDDLVAGYLGTPGAAPTVATKPALPATTAYVAAASQDSGSNDMAAFFAHTSAANPLVQPEPTRLGIPEPEPVQGAMSTNTRPAASATGQGAGSWLDLLASQTLDTLSRASVEAETIVSSQRPDGEKAALLHQVLTTALGQLPLAHLAMVRDAGNPTPPPAG